ncbi:ABC transporter permease YtrF [Sporosarcina sp. NCCP-2222]|uniref:ABC transporter permease n=1 Tax=Sporosarcina sp. NCCP-2222 TaxID=2935073 RepID=UPI002084A415|nr:FtsX-like permease family protein [Sporosarcina sp. NCCP-2222]GKV54928.1 ABC transporter permease YtrF [Sporosarcina sp. NCCP-2222]
MQFKDQLDFVRQHIKKNKLRVFMTILAATMGTAFLIVLASVGFGIHDTMRKEILDNRAVNEIEVYSDQMNESTVEKLKKRDHIKAVVYRQSMDLQSTISLDGFEGSQQLIITDFKEEGKVGFALKEGRLPKTSNEVVVGSHFAQNLIEPGEDPELPVTYDGELMGKQFTYQMGLYDEKESFPEETAFTIVGIAKEPAKDWIQDANIYADESIIPTLNQIYQANVEEPDGELFYGNVKMYADKLENVKTVSNALKEEGYSVYSIADQLEQIDVFFLAFKAGLVFVGTIAILIASIGIFNTMTMAVTERTREIGVMKAIGASPKLIQRLFLMESAWIGILGTVIAVILSYGISYIANMVLPMIVSAALSEEDLGGLDVTFSIIPWQLVLIASAISITVAMVSGWRPARKATKIDVIQALRQEL